MLKLVHLWPFFLVVFCLFFLPVDKLPARTILVKLAADAPVLAKGSTNLLTTGSAAVDAVFAAFQVDKFSPVFSPQLLKNQNTDLGQWIIAEAPDDKNSAEILAALLKSGVWDASENRALQIHFRPNDPLYAEQYALQDIQAEPAWDIQRGARDVIVAVIDTGIDYAHPDITNNLWLNDGEDLNHNGQIDAADFNGIDDDGNGFVDDLRGWDFTDAPNYPDGGDYLERDADPLDEHGHGTGVAGIIAAEADNDTGVAGLAHNCRVMNLRAFNSSGYGEEDDAASAILYAIANGARVINMSFGDVFVSRLLDDVIKYAYQRGAVLVASAGNSATDEIHYPSGFAETISVGACEDNDRLAGFSNFGPTVDLVAPGSYVLSLDLDQEYNNWSGTSFSGPYVAAAAALLLSRQPELTADAVRAILANSADDLGDDGWDNKFGAGRLNVYRALTRDSHAIAQITTPRLDAGYSSGPIAIYGSAWSQDFVSYDLYYGEGYNPIDWIAITTGLKKRVIDGLLGAWENLPNDEGDYTLKLNVTSAGSRVTEHSTRIFIDRTNPIVSNVQLLPMLDGDNYSVLIMADTDDLCEGALFYRQNGGEWRERPLTYRTRLLRYNLSQQEAEGELEVWLKIKNGAGLETILDNNGAYFKVDLNRPPIDVSRFSPTALNAPLGRLLAKTADFNQNGLPELVMNKSVNGAIGPLALYEFDGATMTEVFATEQTRIPRDIGDSDNDGRLEILCGFGFNSYVYESTGAGDFPANVTQTWEGDGSNQFWASRFADLDADGKGEIVMRVVRPLNEGTTDRFELFETTGDNQYAAVAVFVNPTNGENFNGVPHSEIGDFDGDGAREILLGDSDGDIYIYENTGDNTYTATWQDKLPLLDSGDFLAAGDFDGDGVDEFIAGCHSDPNVNTEHDYDARHWYYRLYDQFGDNDYRPVAEWRLFGYESVRDFLSGVSCGDIDNDAADEIYIAAYPDFYVIDFADNAYNVIHHQAPVRQSAALAADANADGKKELWLSDGLALTAYDRIGADTGPATPAAFKALPLNATSVRLTWRIVPGAQNYVLYRSLDGVNLTRLATVTGTSYNDLAVEKDQLYHYAVLAVDPAKTPAESRLSVVAAARPGVNPALASVVAETGESIRLRFSAPMNSSIKQPANFIVGESTHPTAAAIDFSGQEVVLTFAARFSPGDYAVFCADLADQFNVPLDSTKSSAQFVITESLHAPYIAGGAMLNAQEIELVFDQPMVKESVENPANYFINNESVVSRAAQIDPTTVRLLAENLRLFATAGDTIVVRAREVIAGAGRSTKFGRGDAITFVVPGSADNGDTFKVYPNPFAEKTGARAVTFANLSQDDKVHILTAEGLLIKTLLKSGSNGDLDWDLTNERGDAVASGIYIYRVSGKQERVGKLAILR